MRLTADDFKETNESPTLLKDKEAHPEGDAPLHKFNGKTAKGFRNFWYYHWLHVIIGILATTVLTIFVVDLIQANKPRILSITVLNAPMNPDISPLIMDLASVYDYNPRKECINFETNAFFSNNGGDASQATLLALRTNVAAGDYDIMIVDKKTADYFSEFMNVSEDVTSFLPDDICALYSDVLYKVTPTDYHEITPGFYIENNQRLKEVGLFYEDEPYVLLPLPDGQHYDNMLTFLKFIAD